MPNNDLSEADNAYALDGIDLKILAALQKNGRLTNVELGREVGLSPSPCLRRVRMLEENGTIRQYVAILDPVRLGLAMSVFVRVWLKGQDEDTVQCFIRHVNALSQVVECHLMAGDCDFLLRVVAADLTAYRRFQAEYLARIPSVSSLKTDIPMQAVKVSWELPLGTGQ